MVECWPLQAFSSCGGAFKRSELRSNPAKAHRARLVSALGPGSLGRGELPIRRPVIWVAVLDYAMAAKARQSKLRQTAGR